MHLSKAELLIEKSAFKISVRHDSAIFVIHLSYPEAHDRTFYLHQTAIRDSYIPICQAVNETINNPLAVKVDKIKSKAYNDK